MTSARRIMRESPVLVTGVVLGLVLGAADLLSGAAPVHAAIAFGITAAWAVLVTILGRRSETFSVLAGRPVDERWEQMSIQACAVALGVSALFALSGVASAELQHGDPMPYALVAAVMGVSYLGTIAWLRLRQ